MENPKHVFRQMTSCKTAACLLVGLLLTGCVNNNSPAPIHKASSVPLNTESESEAQGSITHESDSSGSNGGWVAAPSSIEANDNNDSMVQTSEPVVIPVEKRESALGDGSNIPNRNYSQIPKGTFYGEKYIVARGDTLFYIAWITGHDYRTLAKKNNISEPYNLYLGQILDVSGGIQNSVANINNTNNNQPVAILPNTTNSTTVSPTKNVEQTPKSDENVVKTLPATPAARVEPAPVVVTNIEPEKKTAAEIVWRWPAKGKVIDRFSTKEGGNKGIDISGSRGQSIVSAANGRVVYAGNALRGYGNLIIIKHDDDYLSAYAHNDTMLVSEQQDVKAGQKIATMGSTGASSVRLHFEVRFKGKSVNPLQYLPQR